MSTRKGLPNWVDERARKAGPPDREIRFRAAARAIAESILRNRPTTGSPDVPDPDSRGRPTGHVARHRTTG